MDHSHAHHHCQANAMRFAEEICAERNLRFTDIRRRVFSIIWEAHKPVKAYDILGRLSSDLSNQPPTVYRALDFLLKHGLVHKLDSLNAFVGCAHPKEAHECYFMICRSCHTVTECCDPSLAKQLRKSIHAHESEFIADHTTLEIHGHCGTCRANVRAGKTN